MENNDISKNVPQHGGQLLVRQLEQFGIERVFCVPGESYLPVLDALHSSPIKTTLFRQEGGAAMAAEAFGKILPASRNLGSPLSDGAKDEPKDGASDKARLPGICFVTRGPGATNASAGVHVAQQDSTPMILFIGQVALQNLGRDAFQEVDYHAFFGGMAKAVFQIEQEQDIPKTLQKAFQIALEGRMGPVVIALPEEILTRPISAEVKSNFSLPEKEITHSKINEILDLIKGSKRPIAILGGSGWDEASVLGFEKFATDFSLPVACSFRRQMLFNHNHPNYAGDVGLGINPDLKKRIEDADLILLLGGRMSEVPSQNYQLLNIPTPTQALIHIHPSKEELEKLYQGRLHLKANPKDFVKSLLKISPKTTNKTHLENCKAANLAYQKWSAPVPSKASHVQMPKVMEILSRHLVKKSILTNGAGNYATWVHRFWRFQHFNSQLAPTSGSMGFGLPAAISGKLKFPDYDVVCFAGDGCFQMTSQEFGTACQEGAAILVLVIDNGIYGTIRMHQERHFPNRVSATVLQNPDFAQIARAYGVLGKSVEKSEDFEAALIEALDETRLKKRPALLHLKIDPQAITPTKTLDEIRDN